MTLVWKLLRRNISAAQLCGFFMANVLGMMIMLLAAQFYCDVVPMLTGDDAITSADYLIVSKQVKAGFGRDESGFTADEIKDLGSQDFCAEVGAFTPSRYEVRASMGIAGVASFSTDMFFEAVPDEFVEFEHKDWHFNPEEGEVPIVLPRDYLALYNFGFAQTRSLPKLTPDVISMITIGLRLRGPAGEEYLTGRVIGFGTRLNTILVPQSFIDWSNNRLADGTSKLPTRLIMKVPNTADDAIVQYLDSKQWELESDKAQAGRMMFVLRMVSAVVLGIGLLISALSFYILVLSIYLLVQKNTDKLQNLLLIGYSPSRVSLPYQLLVTALNIGVAVLAVGATFLLRQFYLERLWTMFPAMDAPGIWPMLLLAAILLVAVTAYGTFVVRRKIMSIPS